MRHVPGPPCSAHVTLMKAGEITSNNWNELPAHTRIKTLALAHAPNTARTVIISRNCPTTYRLRPRTISTPDSFPSSSSFFPFRFWVPFLSRTWATWHVSARLNMYDYILYGIHIYCSCKSLHPAGRPAWSGTRGALSVWGWKPDAGEHDATRFMGRGKKKERGERESQYESLALTEGNTATWQTNFKGVEDIYSRIVFSYSDLIYELH